MRTKCAHFGPKSRLQAGFEISGFLNFPEFRNRPPVETFRRKVEFRARLFVEKSRLESGL